MKILIIDDSGVMRRIHKNVLIERGIAEDDLIEAEDGQVALALATKFPIDLFLLDWNMPRLNGLEFVKAVRALVQYQRTPIIMITSEAARYSVLEAIQAGVTNYVVKPVQGEALYAKLGPYLGK